MMRSLAAPILLTCATACAVSSLATRHDGHCPDRPPPELRGVRLAGPEDGCPEEWVGCLSLADALELERYLREAQAWMREASARCGYSQTGQASSR